MAKSKNHTNHNQSSKNHRNGIKPVPRQKYASSQGLNQVLRKNNRRARKFDPTVKKSVNLSNKIQSMRDNKEHFLKLIKKRIEKALLRKQKLKEKKKTKKKKKIKKKKK